MTNKENKRFVQVHALVSYAPSNLNRDDMGRPKTAVMGGKERLRISSQSIKRAWRESELFKDALSGHVGYRTKLLGEKIRKALISGCRLSDSLVNNYENPINPKMDAALAEKWAIEIGNIFAKINRDKEDSGILKSEQLVHVSHDEICAIEKLIAEISKSGKKPDKDSLNACKDLICHPVSDVDIALFGRMITADSSKFIKSREKYSVEAAAQVAHPITIHPVVVEDDYFTAVDDLNRIEDDAGAGHLGTIEYGAGVFYEYVCIDRDLLIENLDGNEELATKAIKALIECVAKVGPKGKQATFGSRAYVSYMMVEQGNQQPRSLAAAFIAPMRKDDYVLEGIEKLCSEKKNIDDVYGKCSDIVAEFNVPKGTGKLDDILKTIG